MASSNTPILQHSNTPTLQILISANATIFSKHNQRLTIGELLRLDCRRILDGLQYFDAV